MSNRIGRNDPCPCGSGKKYKRCCMESDLVQVRVATPGDLESFFDTPEECWVCGEAVNPLGMGGFGGHDEVEPDGMIINLGAQRIAVHERCMAEAERRLSVSSGLH